MTKKTTEKSFSQKQSEQNKIDSLDELFEHEDQDEEVLAHARELLKRFVRRVEERMKERDLSKEELAEKVDLSTASLEDILNVEVFPDWISICKLKMELDITFHFYQF